MIIIFSRVFQHFSVTLLHFPQICRVSGTPSLAYYVDLSQKLWDIKQSLLLLRRPQAAES